ncbi:hypothetical protein RRG08_016014 [Elysia crispata]|uniref:Uncharacterized protein n=1 Tax=Elysia crispata TaxID=231223 RepID=A0AAE0YXX0_9GAST|nr:hypothetical protein RRG08_016014 [Elysia crispata]
MEYPWLTVSAERCDTRTQAKGPEWPYVSIVTPYRLAAESSCQLKDQSGLMSASYKLSLSNAVTPGPKLKGVALCQHSYALQAS